MPRPLARPVSSGRADCRSAANRGVHLHPVGGGAVGPDEQQRCRVTAASSARSIRRDRGGPSCRLSSRRTSCRAPAHPHFRSLGRSRWRRSHSRLAASTPRPSVRRHVDHAGRRRLAIPLLRSAHAHEVGPTTHSASAGFDASALAPATQRCARHGWRSDRLTRQWEVVARVGGVRPSALGTRGWPGLIDEFCGSARSNDSLAPGLCRGGLGWDC